MGLREYWRKRRFKHTPEPEGKAQSPVQADARSHKTVSAAGKSQPKASYKKLAFVVQEHHARQLHYDFRLELDGVLKSWAIPKGPSMDPHVRHLAVMTEDHPYDYRTFEGVIPEGNYGAGNVIIWDEGTYEPRAETDGDPQKRLAAELKNGHITFIVHGQKLKGEFALIKLHNAEDDAWLLIKKGDDFATDADITKQDTSVESGKRVDEITDAAPKYSLDDLPKKTKPWTVHPMLCTLVEEIFDRDGWLFEIKWDGYRAIASKHTNDVRLYSRNELDFAEHYPPIYEAVHNLKHDVILDGEIVVTDPDGAPHFEWLQSWRHNPQGELRYYVFDILWLDGHDLRDLPLIERKKLLQSVLPKTGPIRYSDHVEKQGIALFEQMQHRGLEGVVAKRADSTYREDIRGDVWLKIKTHLRQEVVIGGYTEPRGGRLYFGSVLVGVYRQGKFEYVGHSGGGIPDVQRKELLARFKRLERQTSPFAVEPKPNAPVHWLRPEIVCEMSFTEWTDEGYMRHPAFEGLRPDKDPKAVHREKPKRRAVPAGAKVETGLTPHSQHPTNKTREFSVQKAETKLAHNHTAKTRGTTPPASATSSPVEFTHLDKVFFTKHGYTKGDMINYYRSVADIMLSYLADRPHSLLRQPNGISGESFFQKNNEHLPDWVPHADIYSDSNQADLRWIVGGDLNTLLYMVQLGCVEINPWNSRIKHLQKPDWIVIDLDPEGVGFASVIKVAQTVKAVCDDWDIPCRPKTSGKTGIHIYIPLGAQYDYDQARNLAHLMALEINRRQPELTSVERKPEKRRNRIYVDYLQNREGQTLAAPYSLRPTPDATVSMPLHWNEVTTGLKPTNFTIKNALKRIEKTGDLWQPVLGKGIDIKKIVSALDSKTD